MENNSTLERLLRIQGNPKQITLEAAMEETRAPAPVPPAPGGDVSGDFGGHKKEAAPAGAKNQQSEQRGNSAGTNAGKISPAEREAWSSLYRFYEKYAPQLRAAARLDDDNEEAVRVFQSAAAEMNELYQERGLIGKALTIPLFDLLDMVFREAREQVF